MKEMKLLTLEDFEDMEVDSSWSPLDILEVVTNAAAVIYEEEKLHEIKKKEPIVNISKEEAEPSSKKSVLDTSKEEILMMKEVRFFNSIKGNWGHPILDMSKEESLMMKEGQFFGSNKANLAYPILDMSKEERWMEKEEILKSPFKGGIDISKGERLMKEKNSMKKPVVETYPEDIYREEWLRQEKLLKKAVVENPKNSNKKIGKRVRYKYCNSDEEEAKRKTKKKSKNGKKKDMDHGPEPAPDMPKQLKNRILRMGGKDVKLVIQKRIFPTDTKPGHCRLSIPLKQVKNEFLTEEEKESLFYFDEEGRTIVNPMEVPLIEPTSSFLEDCSTISLRRWDMEKKIGQTSSVYALTSQWNEVRTRNNIVEDTILQIWSFRVDGKLHFAMVNLSRGAEEGGSGSGGGSGKESIASTSRGESPNSPSNSDEQED